MYGEGDVSPRAYLQTRVKSPPQGLERGGKFTACFGFPLYGQVRDGETIDIGGLSTNVVDGPQISTSALFVVTQARHITFASGGNKCLLQGQ